MNLIMLCLWGAVLLIPLFALSVIDWRSFRLPNVLTLPLIIAGLLYSHVSAHDLQSSLIGAGLGYGFFWTIERSYKALRGRDGLGRGDAKLLAAGGAWCGWVALPFIVLVASASALLCLLLPTLRKRAQADKKMPFGPFLSLGIFTVWASQSLVNFTL